jgi:2-C-methyl-D-erythritol 4-phosphate cytidylyltransferase
MFVLIAAGGSGSRAGGSLPKQYQQVAGWPVLAHTLRAFGAVPGLAKLLVLTSPNDPHWADFEALLSSDANPTQPWPHWVQSPRAGATRAQTVANGLEALLQGGHGAALSDWVMVHDAARCLISPTHIQALIDAVRPHPVGGLLALPVADTLKQADSAASGQPVVRDTLDRADKWLAQTPQMFRLGVLRDALRMAGDAVTDESSAVEALDLQPLLVRGSAQNIKLTWPEDFALAEAILQSRPKL